MRTWGLVHVHRHVLEREDFWMRTSGRLSTRTANHLLKHVLLSIPTQLHTWKRWAFSSLSKLLSNQKGWGGGQRGKNPFLLSFQPLPGCFRFVTDSCSTSLSRPSSTWATEKSRTREREPACFAHLRSIELYIHKRNKTKKKIPFLDKKSADPATSQWEVGKSQSFSDLTRHKVFPTRHTPWLHLSKASHFKSVDLFSLPRPKRPDGLFANWPSCPITWSVTAGLEPCLSLRPQEFGQQHLPSHRYSNQPTPAVNKHYGQQHLFLFYSQ